MTAKKQEVAKPSEESTEIVVPSAADVVKNKDMLNVVRDRAKSLGEEADKNQIMYIKMTATGLWVHGEGEDELEDGAQYVINPLSYRYGAVAFSNGDFKGEVMVSAFGKDPLPDIDELEKTDPVDKVQESDGWKIQHGILMVDTSGGPNIIYKASSYGGIQALEKLMGTVSDRIDSNPDAFFPVVTLESSSYKHKKYGKKFNPVLNIVGWAVNDTKEIVDNALEDKSEAEDDKEGEAA